MMTSRTTTTSETTAGGRGAEDASRNVHVTRLSRRPLSLVVLCDKYSPPLSLSSSHSPSMSLKQEPGLDAQIPPVHCASGQPRELSPPAAYLVVFLAGNMSDGQAASTTSVKLETVPSDGNKRVGAISTPRQPQTEPYPESRSRRCRFPSSRPTSQAYEAGRLPGRTRSQSSQSAAFRSVCRLLVP